MRYLLLALLILPTEAGSGAGDMSSLVITEVKNPEMCTMHKKRQNCAYLWGLFIGCKECPWKLKAI